MGYTEKFKDPRWQKLRLKILERDNWTCQCCGNTKLTLHVHHRYYIKGKDPWEYPKEALITLCEECHEIETAVRPEVEQLLLNAFREKFLRNEVETFAITIHHMTLQQSPKIIANVFEWAMGTSKIQKELIQRYNTHLKRKHKKRKVGKRNKK